MKLIGSQIEINEDFLPNSDLTYDIYYDGKLNFEARLNEEDNKGKVGLEDAPNVLMYQMDKPFKDFTLGEIEQILNYRGMYLDEDGFEEIDIFMEKSFITLTNEPNPYTKEDIEAIKDNHEKIRRVLMSSGNKEYGDCIIDEICEVLNYPTTSVYYNED